MSIQEASQQAPLPRKPEAKLRLEIPPKPAPQSGSPPPLETAVIADLPEGNVKRIVNKFSKPEHTSKEPGNQPANGTSRVTLSKQSKRPPTVKPKPGRASLQLQIGGELAPPLPLKRNQKPKETEHAEEGDSISVEGGRSGTADFTSLLRMYDVRWSWWTLALAHWKMHTYSLLLFQKFVSCV